MSGIIDLFNQLTDPTRLSALIDTALSGWWVYAAVSAIIYAENAVLLGFIMPGDSLLFALGVVAGSGKISIGTLLLTLIPAAILGDSTGYFLGRRTGPAIFSRPDSRLFKQDNVRRTQEFFRKYGPKVIMLARFMPVVRSFAPFMAGVGQMPYRTFLAYSVSGSALWVLLLTMLGYLLGNVPLVKNNFEKAILLVVALSLLPAVIEYVKHRNKGD